MNEELFLENYSNNELMNLMSEINGEISRRLRRNELELNIYR